MQTQNAQKNDASANGSSAGESHINGTTNSVLGNSDDKLTENGVVAECSSSSATKLNNVNQEMVRLIGQHLMSLGLK